MPAKFFQIIFTTLLLLSQQAFVNTSYEKSKSLSNIVNRHVRSLDFPSASGMGIFFALAVPIDVPDKSISLSLYFEANYGLPGYNETTYVIDGRYRNGIKKRNIDRRVVYDIVQSKLESLGHPGRACLLRAICESVVFPFDRNGLVGDILRIILTPSSSLKESLHPEIEEAERASDCSRYREDCEISLLDLISYVYED